MCISFVRVLELKMNVFVALQCFFVFIDVHVCGVIYDLFIHFSKACQKN